jgi:dephospho-CoA kinase
MKIIGLTGGIAMGKSTVANFFKQQGVPVHDADAAVHELYEAQAVAPIGALLPHAIVNHKVSREILAQEIKQNPSLLPRIEAIVHPLVGAHRVDFLAKATSSFVVYDVPLLFETGGHKKVDCILTVSCSLKTQQYRALSRPYMTAEKLAFILSKQTPDQQKRKNAHFIIDTNQDLASVQRQVQDFLRAYK